MDRRKLLTGLAASVAASVLPAYARAQSFPSKPVRIYGGFGPGSTTDVISRAMAPHMEKTLGQTVIIDNIQGAAGNIAAMTVARAKPDGYTILMATNSMLGANAHLFPSEGLDPTEAFAPIAPVINIGLVIAAGPAAPAKTLAGVLQAGRRAGAMVTYGTPGIGTPMHLIAEMLREKSGAHLSHVPYKGGAQMANDLLSGQIAIGIAAYSPLAGFVQAGRLKPLAVCGTHRLAALPDVPTLAEIVPGMDMGAWGGLVAPRGTPAAVCQRLADAAHQALKLPDVLAQITRQGCDPIIGDAAMLAGMIKTEYEMTGALIRRLHIRQG